jgi:hypothetical protein
MDSESWIEGNTTVLVMLPVVEQGLKTWEEEDGVGW